MILIVDNAGIAKFNILNTQPKNEILKMTCQSKSEISHVMFYIKI
ncbi:protein of unknown function [Xenorhabdus bovienii]|uniref:Uncharacterized protein n=1 Tax=Xenorhabdus bovienii TaxID=40576 RepID=A0A0B6X5M7_XENBV|nr:protein of unknown function [Xenorhabdus bovienii]